MIMIPSSSHGLSYSTFSNQWRHRGSGSHPALFDEGSSRSLATTAKTATTLISQNWSRFSVKNMAKNTDQSWWFDYAIYIYISLYINIYQYMGICVSVLLKYVGGWIDMGNFRVETPWFSPPRFWGKLQQQSMGISPLPKCGRDNQPS